MNHPFPHPARLLPSTPELILLIRGGKSARQIGREHNTSHAAIYRAFHRCSLRIKGTDIVVDCTLGAGAQWRRLQTAQDTLEAADRLAAERAAS